MAISKAHAALAVRVCRKGTPMTAQPELTLFHFPGACSQVSVCALEEAGLDYRLELVNLAAGQQGSAEFLAVNPMGKVPYLLIDGVGLAENSAILTYVAALRPGAGLFPTWDDPRMRAESVGGMSFCAGTIHPAVRGLANPQRLTTGETAGVKEKATELAGKAFKQAEYRIAARGWWLGEWSIVDVYLHWAFGVAIANSFDTAPFPELVRLTDRLSERPAFRRMLDVNQQARTTLKG
jgi:glutathione S-transferase